MSVLIGREALSYFAAVDLKVRCNHRTLVS